jgi:hypothetical protein
VTIVLTGGGDHGTPVASSCCGVNNRVMIVDNISLLLLLLRERKLDSKITDFRNTS